MPFAIKFRAMFDWPLPGDTLPPVGNGAAFTVESVEVGHQGRLPGLYVYPIEMVLRGPGGLAAARRVVKALFERRCTTFSGYGTPYQLWPGKPTITPLGGERYAVASEGVGARVHLREDLLAFAAHLAAQGALTPQPAADAATAVPSPADQIAAVVDGYLDAERARVARLANRYRSRLRRRAG